MMTENTSNCWGFFSENQGCLITFRWHVRNQTFIFLVDGASVQAVHHENVCVYVLCVSLPVYAGVPLCLHPWLTRLTKSNTTHTSQVKHTHVQVNTLIQMSTPIHVHTHLKLINHHLTMRRIAKWASRLIKQVCDGFVCFFLFFEWFLCL